MKSFNEWLCLKENSLLGQILKFTLQGTGGKLKFDIERVEEGVATGHVQIRLVGMATVYAVATSASGRINHILGGLDNKKITHHEPGSKNYDQDVYGYGYERTSNGVKEPGFVAVEISRDGLRWPEEPNQNHAWPLPQAHLYFAGKVSNWQNVAIKSIDKASASIIVDLVNQKLKSSHQNADWKPITIRNLELQQKIS